jgi:hypothetical protein
MSSDSESSKVLQIPLSLGMENCVHAICEKCSQPLRFIEREYKGVLKWVPVNPDGSDHWDLCKKIQRQSIGLIREDGTVNMEMLAAISPGKVGRTRITHVYCDESAAPWDDSLGEYRDFTPVEKAEGLVCKPIQ